MSTALAKTEPAALARVEELDLGVPVEQLLARVKKIRAVQAEVMQEGLHYGKIPGVDKPTLLKPGAEMLGMTFQLDPQFSIDERREGDHLECVVTCTLYNIPTGHRVGSGIGSCSTRESKYAYRKGERKCPTCGQAAIIKGKEQYGGGWLCWNKPEKGKHGCGAKFADGDKSIENQDAGRVANPDIADQYNTVRKMACKRAHVAAILFACGASELFTQDVEDMPRNSAGDDHGDNEGRPQSQPRRSANGDRPDDNRGRQQQSRQGGQRRQEPSQRDKAADDNYNKMVGLIAKAETMDALEELVPDLAALRDEQAVSLDQYKSLRDVYKARVAFLNNESPAPVGATA